MNTKLKFALGTMAIVLFGVYAQPIAASYVYNQIVFSLDVVASFTAYTLGSAGANFTNSIAGTPGNATEAYYFNSTNPLATLVAPCAPTLLTADCQNGMGKPAYRIRNTGNVNATIELKLSANPTGITLAANSSKPTGCTAGVTLEYTIGNVNSTSQARAGTQIGTNAPCYELNITLYANYDNPPGGLQIKTLTINGTTS